MSDVIVGLDLGQASDPTALAVLRRSMLLTGDGLPARDHRRQPRVRFECVHLERYRLETAYPNIVATVKALIGRPELQPRRRLAIDATGVGRAVVDMFLDAHLPADIHPITLTAGETVRRARWNRSFAVGYWVPKNETIGVTQVLLQTQRLKIARGLQLAEVLRRELLDFRIKITAAAHASFNAREGAHDDVLLSVAIACWLGSRREIAYRAGEPGDRGQIAFDTELKQKAAVIEAEQQAEERLRQEEWMRWDNPALWPRFH
jgi:hypothetical protein